MQPFAQLFVQWKDPNKAQYVSYQLANSYRHFLDESRTFGRFSLNKDYRVFAMTPPGSGVEKFLLISDDGVFAWVDMEWLIASPKMQEEKNPASSIWSEAGQVSEPEKVPIPKKGQKGINATMLGKDGTNGEPVSTHPTEPASASESAQ